MANKIKDTLVIIILVFFLLTAYAYAASGLTEPDAQPFTLGINTVSCVSVGDTVHLSLSIPANMNISLLQFTIRYDCNVLEVLSASQGSAFTNIPGSGAMTINSGIAGKIVCSWDTITTPLNTAGPLLTADFRIVSDTGDISAVYVDDEAIFKVLDENYAEIPTTTVPGGVITGHIYDAGIVSVQATCIVPGEVVYTCINCGNTVAQALQALGHNIVVEPAVAATCTATGLTAGEHCTRCDYKVAQETVPALGHDWDEGKVTTPATETTNGVKTFTCKRCGATKTETIPATGGEDKPCDGGPTCPSYKFTDVKAGDWYHEAVDFAVKNGLFNGMSDTTFEPNTPMTRGMLVTVLWRYEGQPEGGTNNFADVKDGEWYAKAVAWAASKGIVNGVGNGKFDPNGKITREQLAAILYRYSESKGFDTSKTGNLNTFPDAAKVSDWAKTAYSWAVGEGLIGGNVINGKTLLDPRGNATRAQVATILMRFIKNIAHA